MKTEWTGGYRDVAEALIHYCNVYEGVYKNEYMIYQDVSCSQVQVPESENEERRDNMPAIATRLGISRSDFTMIVNRPAAKGLAEKPSMGGRKKS